MAITNFAYQKPQITDDDDRFGKTIAQAGTAIAKSPTAAKVPTVQKPPSSQAGGLVNGLLQSGKPPQTAASATPAANPVFAARNMNTSIPLSMTGGRPIDTSQSFTPSLNSSPRYIDDSGMPQMGGAGGPFSKFVPGWGPPFKKGGMNTIPEKPKPAPGSTMPNPRWWGQLGGTTEGNWGEVRNIGISEAAQEAIAQMQARADEQNKAALAASLAQANEDWTGPGTIVEGGPSAAASTTAYVPQEEVDDTGTTTTTPAERKRRVSLDAGSLR